jgi:hypothetical protein
LVSHAPRYSVQTLVDYLEAGESVDDFLEDFPSLTRRDANDRNGLVNFCATNPSGAPP